MELLASLFVGKPLNILASAVLFLAGYLVLRFTARGISRHPRALISASTAWGLYAAWEWLVQIKTPEANIRVDLLVMWPVLAIVSAWALCRAFR
jgi:ABC-type proline/glycine betaine transport system permease subunit